MMTEHDTDVPGIAIVRSSRGWARTLHRYVVDHGGAIVRTRPLEERQALEEDYDILVVDDISSFLNNRIIEELHRRGRRVLGVYDPDDTPRGDTAGKDRLLRLGVDGVIEAQAMPEEFVRVIGDLAPPRARHDREHDDLEIDLRDHLPFSPASPFADHDAGRGQQGGAPGNEIVVAPRSTVANRRRGHVTVVLGVSGGTGTTEITIELARALGRRGERAVLVDGDDVGPSIAQRLNLGLHPNIRTAVDVVEHRTGRLAECLTTIATNLDVLAGLPHPKDWVELRGSDVSAVLDELARGRPHVVVNAAAHVEDLSGLGGADRFGTTRAIVDAADTLVLVTQPTPVGIARLLDRIAELSDLTDRKAVHVVVNRTTKGTYKRNEMANEIRRSFNATDIHFLPSDPRVERAAWDGTLVPAGDFTKMVGASLLPAVPVVPMATAPPRRRAATGASSSPQPSSASSGGAPTTRDEEDRDSLSILEKAERLGLPSFRNVRSNARRGA